MHYEDLFEYQLVLSFFFFGMLHRCCKPSTLHRPPPNLSRFLSPSSPLSCAHQAERKLQSYTGSPQNLAAGSGSISPVAVKRHI